MRTGIERVLIDSQVTPYQVIDGDHADYGGDENQHSARHAIWRLPSGPPRTKLSAQTTISAVMTAAGQTGSVTTLVRSNAHPKRSNTPPPYGPLPLFGDCGRLAEERWSYSRQLLAQIVARMNEFVVPKNGEQPLSALRFRTNRSVR